MAHVFALALCAFVVYLAKPGTSLFSWHPTFMILGFGLFMFEAILVFSPHSSLFSSYDRSTKVKWHWILQVLANLSIFLGFAAIYYNKELNNKPHFTSWHGRVGVFSVVITIIQSLCAISLIYYNVKWLNPLGVTLSLRKKLHAVCGALSFALGYLTLLLSLYSKFVEKNTSDNSWYTLFILMTIVASVVVNQVSATYISGKPNTNAKESGNVKKVSHATTDVKRKSDRKPKSPLSYGRHSPPFGNGKAGEVGHADICTDAISKPFSRNAQLEAVCKDIKPSRNTQLEAVKDSKPSSHNTQFEAVGKETICEHVTREPPLCNEEVEVVSEETICGDNINEPPHCKEAEETNEVSSSEDAISEPPFCNETPEKQSEETISEYVNSEPPSCNTEVEDIEEETKDNGIHEVESKSASELKQNELPDASIHFENGQQSQQSEEPRYARRVRQRRNIQGAIPWNTLNI